MVHGLRCCGSPSMTTGVQNGRRNCNQGQATTRHSSPWQTRLLAWPGRCCEAAKVTKWRDRSGSGPQSDQRLRSEEHTSELQSLMRISYAVFCLQKKLKQPTQTTQTPKITP